MREILTRLVDRMKGAVEIIIFGDKVILDEGELGPPPVPWEILNCQFRDRIFELLPIVDVENWPLCDVLISFFSTDFPLDKAIAYAKLRDVYCINDLIPQALLWDRRLVAQVLNHLGVPIPPQCEVSRDGGPKVDKELREHMKKKIGINLGGFQVTPEVSLREDGDAIIIDGKVLEKPFVEKPVSGEDHNVYIYFRGGGGRRLFRKVRLCYIFKDELVFTAGIDWEQVERTGPDVELSEDGRIVHLRKVYRSRKYGGHQGVHRRLRVYARGDKEVSCRGRTRAKKPGGKGNQVSRTWDMGARSNSVLPFSGSSRAYQLRRKYGRLKSAKGSDKRSADLICSGAREE